MQFENLIGQVISKYKLLSLLGTGNMGAVYRGYQADLNREVAVKILPAALALQPGYLERFRREAATSARLEHPHIVPVYDFGTEGTTSFVVMRLLTGGSLSDRLKNAEAQALPSPGEIAQLLHQISAALDYAHTQNVIHRDIKPSNVMFDNHGSAFLVDFGIAKLLDVATSLTAAGVAIGTPVFMAPEQWRGDTLSAKTDQYALAVMVYYALTGSPPFVGNSRNEIMNKHLMEPPPNITSQRSELPAALDIVMKRALAKNPQDRFASAQDFTEAFDSAIRGFAGMPTAFFSRPVAPIHSFGTPTPTPHPSQPVIPRPMATETGHRTTRAWYKSPILWVVLILIAGLVGAFIAFTQLGQDDEKDETPAVAQGNTLSETPTQANEVSDPPTSATDTPDPTATPTENVTPTQTLNAIDAAQATFDYFDTQTATLFTFTPSPDASLTADALATQAGIAELTQIAALFTDTPTATPTNTSTQTPLPSPTTDFNATVDALLTATADSWTETPIATATNTASLTPTISRRPTRRPTGSPTPTPPPDFLPALINGNNINLRAGPSTNYPVTDVGNRGTRVELITTSDEWGYIRYNDRYGWIVLSLLDITGNPASLADPADVNVVLCDVPSGGFSDDWATLFWQLGCSNGSEISTTGSSQDFENGVMVARTDSDQIYVILFDGRWTVYADDYRAGESLTCFRPFLQDAFGKVFCSHPEIQDFIGDPTGGPRRDSTLRVQEYERGLIFDISVVGTRILTEENFREFN